MTESDVCEPYCGVFDLPATDAEEIEACGACGSVWELRPVTEVDPSTGQPVTIQSGWVRV